jgi:acetyl-CoA C-acetyltransferase
MPTAPATPKPCIARRSVETYQRAGIVSEPLNLFDVAPNADGAAAALLVRRDLLPVNYPHPLVRISGSSLVTDTLALHDRPTRWSSLPPAYSVERACRLAASPRRTWTSSSYTTNFRFTLRSLWRRLVMLFRVEGWQLAQNGRLRLAGSLPIATMGGLKARGNPGGATAFTRQWKQYCNCAARQAPTRLPALGTPWCRVWAVQQLQCYSRAGGQD